MSYAYVAEPPPLESTDPELAEHIRLLANRQHPFLRAVNVQQKAITLYTTLGVKRKMRNLPGRNDPCLCGSGKKFKKCCGR